MTSTPNKAKGSAKRVAALRFEILNAFVDWTMADLSRAEMAVWFVLYRDTKNTIAKTGMSDLARRAVVTAIASLKGRGLLKTMHKSALNRGPSSYRVLPFVKDG